MKIKFKKLHKDAIIPSYQTAGASGFDFHALSTIKIAPGETKLVRTGLAVSLPEGFAPHGEFPICGDVRQIDWELQVRPRSGLSLKTPLRVANSPGTVDRDYRGEIGIIITNLAVPGPDVQPITIKKGDRIAQGVICPVMRADIEEADELPETDRGEGGYGSTGT